TLVRMGAGNVIRGAGVILYPVMVEARAFSNHQLGHRIGEVFPAGAHIELLHHRPRTPFDDDQAPRMDGDSLGAARREDDLYRMIPFDAGSDVHQGTVAKESSAQRGEPGGVILRVISQVLLDQVRRSDERGGKWLDPY